MKYILLLLISISAAMTADLTDEDEPLVVPKPVMKFIMGCKRSIPEEDFVPVYRTDINSDSGTTSQQVSLLGIDELQSSLKTAIESDDVTTHIMSQIDEQFNKMEEANFRSNCPVTHTINIDVPPQELEVFHTRMERVMQQNNNVLLRHINDMISTKFTNVQQTLTKLIENKTSQINQKLDQLLFKGLSSDANVTGTPSSQDEFIETEQTNKLNVREDIALQNDSEEDATEESSNLQNESTTTENASASSPRSAEKIDQSGAAHSENYDAGQTEQGENFDHISSLSEILRLI